MKLVVGQGDGFFQPQFGTSVQPFTQTMTNLLESEIVARTVITELDLGASPTQLLSKLKVRTRPESSVLEVSYDSASKALALRVVDRVGTVFTRLVRERLNNSATADPPTPAEEGGVPITASIFDPAHLEPAAVSPRPVRTAVFAGAFGLVIALLLVFFRESLDETVRGRKEAETWFGAPLFGVIPHVKRPTHPSIAVEHGLRENGEFLGALHMLRAKFELSRGDTAPQIIVVTSAVAGEGKTTVVANVAAVLAASGKDVVCVEADSFRPRLGEYLGIDATGEGFYSVLEGRARLNDVLQHVPLHDDGRTGIRQTLGAGNLGELGGGARHEEPREGRLRILVAEPISAERAHVLRRDAVGRLLDALRSNAEYVIVDTPPMLLTGNAFPFMMAADTVLISARARRTTRGAAEAVNRTLESLGIRDVAVVLTDVKQRGTSYGTYGAYQPYEFRDEERDRRAATA